MTDTDTDTLVEIIAKNTAHLDGEMCDVDYKKTVADAFALPGTEEEKIWNVYRIARLTALLDLATHPVNAISSAACFMELYAEELEKATPKSEPEEGSETPESEVQV